VRKVQEEKKRLAEEKQKRHERRLKIEEDKKKLEEEKKRIEEERTQMEKEKQEMEAAMHEMEQENLEIFESMQKAREQANDRKNLDLIEEELIMKREAEWKKKRKKRNPNKIRKVNFNMPEGEENKGLEDEEIFVYDEEEEAFCVVCGETDAIGQLYPCHGTDCGRMFHIPCAGIHPQDYSLEWLCMTCVS